ncbi:MAG: hypothetical protein GTO62_18430, partial [Planctomycetales bacterium]|nr:hypothetical protein [Planctomycetales bacterium]
SEPEQISYYRDIRPIFQGRCFGCHQPAKPSGQYVMTDFSPLSQGGESGEPAIVAGAPGDSYLIELITPIDGEADMPKEEHPLDANQIELVR